MANIDSEARIPVYINDEQAKSALKTLTAEAEKWRKKMYEAMAGGDLKGMKNAERELKNVNKQASQLQKEAFDVNKVLANISSAPVNDLRKAMTAVNREMAGLNRDSKEYQALMNKKLAIKDEFARINGTLKEQPGFFSRASTAINKYFLIVAASGAAIIGFVSKMYQAVRAADQFNDRMANLSALTGLAGADLDWLGNKAKELSTSTLDGGVNITKSADDIVDAFTKMGSARPELLKDRDALVEVTKKALILAEASKMEMQPAIEAVAAAMNQFQMETSQSTEIINTLAAGSLAGSAEVENLTKSLSTVGPVAKDSNLSLEQTIGVLETLAERQLKDEEAGTQLKTTLISLKAAGLGYTSGIFNMRDALVELKGKIDAKKTALEKDNEIISVFGKRNITVGTILVNNISRFDEFTKAVTGTNVAMQQAATNTNTDMALKKQAVNEYHRAAIELGQNLSPAFTAVFRAAASVTRAFSDMIAVPISEKLRDEQFEVNNLVHSIVSINDNQKLRNSLIQELQQKYPDFLGNINAEKISNEQLLKTLDGVNKSYLERIRIAVNEEDIKKNETEMQKVWKQQRETIKQIDQDYQRMVKNKNENATLDEKLSAIARSTLDVMVGNTVQSQKQDVLAQMYKGKLIGLQQQENALTKDYNDLLKERETINPPKPLNPQTPSVDSTSVTPVKLSPEDAKKASDAALKLLDISQNEIMSHLVDQYDQQGWTDSRFKAQQLIAEQAYLEEKRKILLKYGQDTLDVDNQINQKRIDAQKAWNALISENDNTFLKDIDDATKSEEKIIGDSIDETGKSIKGSLDVIKDAKDKEEKLLRERAQMYQMISGTIVDSLSSMLDGSLDQYATYGDALILMALQILKQMAPIWAAQIVGGSLATPDSIMTGGIAGIAKFTAMLAIMEGFIAIAEGAVKKKIDNRRQAAGNKGFSEGGPTGPGSKYEVAGVVHKKEYVIPEEGYDNPNLRPFIDIIEIARKNHSLARLDLRPVMMSVSAGKNMASGGPTSGGSTSSQITIASAGNSISPDDIRLFSSAVKELVKYKPELDIRTFAKKWNDFEKYTKGGLG